MMYEDYIKITVKGYIKKKLNLKTFCSYNKEATPKDVLFFIHGMGTQCNRVTKVAQYFSDAGYFICGLDLRQNELSDYDLSYIYNFDDVINDVIQFVK